MFKHIRLLLILVCTTSSANATCLTNLGDELDSGMMDCIKDGNRYSDTIDPDVLKHLAGQWAHDCRDASIRVRIVSVASDDKIVSAGGGALIEFAVQVGSTVIGANLIGSTYRLNYKDVGSNDYSSYVYSLLPDASIQLMSLSRYKDGAVNDLVIAGVNLSTGKYTPRLIKCH